MVIERRGVGVYSMASKTNEIEKAPKSEEPSTAPILSQTSGSEDSIVIEEVISESESVEPESILISGRRTISKATKAIHEVNASSQILIVENKKTRESENTVSNVGAAANVNARAVKGNGKKFSKNSRNNYNNRSRTYQNRNSRKITYDEAELVWNRDKYQEPLKEEPLKKTIEVNRSAPSSRSINWEHRLIPSGVIRKPSTIPSQDGRNPPGSNNNSLVNKPIEINLPKNVNKPKILITVTDNTFHLKKESRSYNNNNRYRDNSGYRRSQSPKYTELYLPSSRHVSDVKPPSQVEPIVVVAAEASAVPLSVGKSNEKFQEKQQVSEIQNRQDRSYYRGGRGNLNRGRTTMCPPQTYNYYPGPAVPQNIPQGEMQYYHQQMGPIVTSDQDYSMYNMMQNLSLSGIPNDQQYLIYPAYYSQSYDFNMPQHYGPPMPGYPPPNFVPEFAYSNYPVVPEPWGEHIQYQNTGVPRLPHANVRK